MALENAQKFIKDIMEDEKMRERFAKLSTEEGLAAAKEMGLDFTEEELKEAGENYELSPEQLEMASGGNIWDAIKGGLKAGSAGAALGTLIGCIGGPVGAAIGFMVGGGVGVATGTFAAGFNSDPD